VARISTDERAVTIRVIPTDVELVVARHTASLASSGQGAGRDRHHVCRPDLPEDHTTATRRLTMSDTMEPKSQPSQRDDDTANALPLIGPDMAVASGQAMVQGLSEYLGEMSRFFTRRLEADMTLQRQLVNCKGPADVFAAFSAFTLTAVRDYSEQADKMQKTVAASMWQGIRSAD
jgi:hypothetical protein